MGWDEVGRKEIMGEGMGWDGMGVGNERDCEGVEGWDGEGRV